MLIQRTVRRASIPGFTLIELMVTLALFALLLMLAVPSFTQWVRNNQIRSTAESLQNGLRLAKTQATTLNRQVVFSLTNATPANNVMATASGLNWTAQTVPLFVGDPDQQFIQGGNFAKSVNGITIVGAPASGPSVDIAVLCFNSIGQLVANATPGTGIACTAQATNFVVSRASAVTGQDRPLTVQVSLSGQVRMCDPNRPIGSPDAC